VELDKSIIEEFSFLGITLFSEVSLFLKITLYSGVLFLSDISKE